MASAFFVLALSIAWSMLSAPSLTEMADGGAAGIMTVHFPAQEDAAARDLDSVRRLDAVARSEAPAPAEGATAAVARGGGKRKKAPIARNWATALSAELAKDSRRGQ